jgi:DNA sulfur modification protein DndD
MQFESLALQNVGLFRGEHKVELLTHDSSRPVVLVGALNGSGKTTFIEALQLALYGRRAGYGWRGMNAYNSYLQQLRNRHVSSADPMAVELTLQLTDGRRLRVRRYWSFLKDTPREGISVYVNDADLPDLQLSEGWDEEVERLLPVRLSELFFFDGEKIEKLADPSRSGEVIKTAVAALMGLDLVDHLDADLEILRGRLRQRLLPESDRIRMAALDSELEHGRSQLGEAVQDLASNQNALEHAQNQLAGAKRRFEAAGGDRFRQREALAETRATLKAQAAATAREGHELAAGCLPLALVSDLLIGTLRSTASDVGVGHQAAVEARCAELTGLRRWAEGRKLTSAVRRELESYVAERLESLGAAATGGPAVSASYRFRLQTLIEERLPTAQEKGMRFIRNEARLSERLLQVEEQLRLAPDTEQVAASMKEAALWEERVSVVQAERERLTAVYRSQQHAQELRSRERQTILERANASDDAGRAADYCARARGTLAAFRANLIQRRRTQLEQLILDAFQVLARKPDLVHRISIDAETMVVRLFSADELEVGANQLSAGERQLLAIAILWGLARASGRPVPVVIDTPLGRLDGEHRRALVERYFPDASHQVILLSTDQEVDAEYSDLLDDAIAHRYLIEYNSERRSSAFATGYFG